MKLSKPQAEIARDPHRFKVAICGRRFGKTYLAIRQMARHAVQPNQNVWYITSSYRAAKMIVWKPLKNLLWDLRWTHKVNESELSIELKNGSTISLKGAENYDSLRGSSISYVVFDEVADIPPAAWYEVVRPALADQQGGALFIGTPKSQSNWSYDLYLAERDNPDWRSWQFTTIEGGRVSSEEIESARQDMDIRQFRQEFLATFESYEGRITPQFDLDHNVKRLENPDVRDLHVGGDFNVSPITASICVRQGDDLYVIDEIHMHNSNTQELAAELRSRYPHSRITFYPDPSGNQRKTSANGQTDHTILANWGFRVKAPRKHDLVRDRINATNARICDANGDRHLFVDPRCKHHIESLLKYSYREGTQTPNKDTGLDHQFDALSYGVAYQFPLRRIQEAQQPQRWGTKTL